MNKTLSAILEEGATLRAGIVDTITGVFDKRQRFTRRQLGALVGITYILGNLTGGLCCNTIKNNEFENNLPSSTVDAYEEGLTEGMDFAVRDIADEGYFSRENGDTMLQSMWPYQTALNGGFEDPQLRTTLSIQNTLEYNIKDRSPTGPVVKPISSYVLKGIENRTIDRDNTIIPESKP